MIDFAYREFKRCLREIENGNLEYKEYALELSDKYCFPLREVNKALRIGVKKRFEELLEYIRNGYLNLEEEALRLYLEYGEDNHNLSYERLLKALEEGKMNELKLF